MFVGRKRELATLNSLYERGGFQMVVIYGRRRVGKTALINEFARGKRTLSFTALEQGDAANLADFSRKIAEFFNLPASMCPFSTWLDAFDYVADQAAREPFVFIFDELPYAAQRGESVPSALQIAIDRKLQNTEAFLILCGSDQGFMESDVLGRKSPLYGRHTAQIKLGPLGYREAAEMLPGLDPQEQFRFYGCFGGVPYYLRQVDPAKSLRENLASLYFDPTGFLFDEPYGLLRQGLSEPALYAGALRAIASGATKSKEIAEKAGMAGGAVSAEQLTAVAAYFGRQASALADTVPRDETGCFAVGREEIMADTAGAYDGLTERWPFLAGPERRAKPAFYSKLMSAWGFTGYLCPLTGESTLNVDCPAVFLPVTIAHEYAHQRGVAAEQEANFVGILASITSGTDAWVYSGWLYGYLHLSNALWRADPEAAAALSASLPAGIQADFAANNAYWASWEGPVREVGETVYDAFLHSYGQELGMQSYGACVDLLVEAFWPVAQN